MYRLFSILLIFMITGFALAQDEAVIMPDDLPEPIFTTERSTIYLADPHQFAWIDNETLVFTPFNKRTEGWEDDSTAMGYVYDLNSETLIELETSPFHTTMQEEYRDLFEVMPDTTVHQSPYVQDFEDGNTLHHIVYTSQFFGRWSLYDYFNSIMMRGRYFVDNSDEINRQSSSFMPIRHDFGADILFWSPNNQSFVIQKSVTYGAGYSISHINEEGEDVHVRYGLSDDLNDRILVISEDGNHLAFSSHSNDDPLAVGQSLYIWQAPYHDELCACTYDAQIIDMIAPIDGTQEISFAGVGFVNENTILYIGELGLMRHNLLTGISVPIDRELNVGWIRTAVFSPDFQHVAITTEQGLFILPLSL